MPTSAHSRILLARSREREQCRWPRSDARTLQDMAWHFAVRWGLRLAWIVAALALILVLGGWSAWFGYAMLGAYAAAVALLLLFRTLLDRFANPSY